MIDNYKKYLEFLEEKLNRFFDNQKEYIFCKKGCSKCCENTELPFSQVEASYILTGAMELDPKTQTLIDQNIHNILEEKKRFQGEKFRYTCPFLINNVCSVYQYRGIICRAFGLITADKDDKIKAPFCYELGLNFSNVIDKETGNVSREKFEKLGIEHEPVAYNVGYAFLTSEAFEKTFNFEFGQKKPLIEWFIPEETPVPGEENEKQ